MKLALHDADVIKTATKLHVHSSGATKAAARGSARDSGLLKQFYAALQVSLSSTSVIGRANSANVVVVTSAPVTASVQGAVGTAAHNWTRTDSGTQPWTIDDPTSATTTFSTSCNQGEDFTATFIDTITDEGGQSLASATVTVDCANIYYGGGYAGSYSTPGKPYP